MADTENGDGHKAGGRRSRSTTRRLFGDNNAENGSDGDPKVTLEALAEELPIATFEAVKFFFDGEVALAFRSLDRPLFLLLILWSAWGSESSCPA